MPEMKIKEEKGINAPQAIWESFANVYLAVCV